MSAAEASPILIPSEDEEFEDGEDVQYIKEEKAPPITIDETEDQEQDDVIFVSTCPPPPTPTLPPSWDDSLGISDVDLGTFDLGLGTSAPSSSGQLGDMQQIMNDSLAPSVAVGAADLPSLGTDFPSLDTGKLTVGSSDLSTARGSFPAVGSAVTDLVSGAGVPDLSDVQLHPVGTAAPAMPTLPSANGLDAQPGGGSVGGGKSVAQGSLLCPASAPSPLHLAPADKIPAARLLRKKTKMGRKSHVPAYSDSDSSSSADSSSDDGDTSDEDSDGTMVGMAGATPSSSLVSPSSQPVLSCLTAAKSKAESQPTGSSRSSGDVSGSPLAQPAPLHGLAAVSGPAPRCSASNIPPPATSASRLSAVTDWLDLNLSLSTTISACNTSFAHTSSGAPLVQPAASTVFKVRTANHSSSTVIQPPHTVGATSTTAARLSFNSSDIMQASRSVNSHGATPTNTVSPTTATVQGKSCSSVCSNSTGPSTAQPAPAQSLSSVAGPSLPHTQSQLSGSQQAGSSKGTASSGCVDTVLTQLPTATTSTKSLSEAATQDFFDKLLGDCNTILSCNSTVPSTSFCSTSTVSFASSTTPGPAQPGSSAVKPLSSDTVDTVSDKTAKRPNPSSLSALNNSSLPPRKRVRPPLMHSSSFTTSAASSLAPPSAVMVPQSLSGGSQDSKTHANLSRSSSYPATSQLAGSFHNQSGLGAGGMPGTVKGAVPLSMPSTSRGDTVSVTMAVGVQSVAMCTKCHMREGERTGEGGECKLSLCPQGHAACGSCLMVQARRVLSGKQKETLQCIVVACSTFYTINELRNSLPSLIVEILQERLDQEFVEIIDNMMTDKDDDQCANNKLSSDKMKSRRMKPSLSKRRRSLLRSTSGSDDPFGDDSLDDIDDSESEMTPECLDGDYDDFSDTDAFPGEARLGGKDGEKQNDFPEHWTRMDNSKNLVEVVGVPLEPDSDEYINVAVRFHEHLFFPATDINRIVRIQNPYLWKSYSLKKEQMIQENDKMAVNEYQLFHGTKGNTVEAICRRGFDWRFCGKHGTAYGHGCYFAGDSYYSNTYTDRSNAPSTAAEFLKTVVQMSGGQSPSPSPHTTAPTPQPPPHSSSQQTQRGGPPPLLIQGPSSLSSASKGSLKKLLPLLKSGLHNKQTLLAQLLKKRALLQSATSAAAQSSTQPPSAQCPPVPGLPGGPSHASQHPGSSSQAVARPQQAHSQASSQLHQHARYSLLTGSKRHSLAPAGSVQPVQLGHHGNPGTQNLHPGQLPPPAMGSSSSHKAHSGFSSGAKPSFFSQSSKKYVSRVSAFSSGSQPPGKPVLPRSSSSQLPGQHGGGLVVPMCSYQAALSAPTTAVTLSNAVALLAASPVSSASGSGYLLVAPLATPATASVPPSLGPLHPPAHQLLNQPAHLPGALPPKPSHWHSASLAPASSSSLSSAAAGQALDLRKSGSSTPRYMFLAKVLTGKATGGQPEYRRPPPLDVMDPLGRCYDSCVDNIYHPRIWVIFDSTQAYPEYVIEYIVNEDVYR